MYNSIDRLAFILDSMNRIQKRMLIINVPEDFINTDEGVDMLDSITMRLQAIGENFNKILKEDKPLIEDQLQIDVAPIIGFRNFISHHYELLDHQIIYKICTVDLPPLKQIITNFLSGKGFI